MYRAKLGLICVAFLLGVAISPHAHGQNQRASLGRLKGKIVATTDGLPVSRSFVLIHGESGLDKMIAADESGRYEADLSDGLYDVMVGKIGWMPNCRLEVRSGQTAFFNAK